MKKLLAMVLTLAFLAAALPLTVAAEAAEETADFSVIIPEATLYAGEDENIVTLTVDYETALTILDGMLEVTYDPEALELQIPKKIDRLCKLGNGQVNADQAGLIRIGFMNSAGLDETGTIGEFPFKVLDPQIGTEHTVSVRFTRLMSRGDSAIGLNLVTDTNDFRADGKILVAERPPVDLSQLEQAVEELEIPAEDLAQYTEESAAAFTTAFAAAQRVLADPKATQEQVNEALAALDAAREALVEAPPVLKGDADGNGTVDSTDARLTLQIAVNKIGKEDVQNPDVIDINGNGMVDSTDARLILQYAVEKITEWP